MAPNLPLKAFLSGAGAALLTEFLGRYILEHLGHYHYPALAVLRVVQIVLMLEAVSASGQTPARLGLSRQTWRSGLRAGVFWSFHFGLAVGLLAILLYLIGVEPFRLFSMNLPDRPLDTALFFLVGGVISPVAEEIFFRGLIFGYFRRWGLPLALVLSVVCFAASHGRLVHIPATQIVGGLVFGLAYEYGGSLVTPMVIHVLANLCLFTLGILAR